MNLLIDTNAWIYFFQNAPQLSEIAADMIESNTFNLHVSVASVWEASIKSGLNKLRLTYSLQTDLLMMFERNGFNLLPLEAEDALAVEHLPQVHRDPFDRIQAVQCQRRGWDIISCDAVFDAYDLKRIW